MSKSSKEYAEERGKELFKTTHPLDTVSLALFVKGYLDCIEQTGVKEKDKELKLAKFLNEKGQKTIVNQGIEIKEKDKGIERLKNNMKFITDEAFNCKKCGDYDFLFEMLCHSCFIKSKDADLKEMVEALKKSTFEMNHAIKFISSKEKMFIVGVTDFCKRVEDNEKALSKHSGR